MSTQTDDTPRSGPPPLRTRPTPAPFPLNLYQTAVGKKWVMALTGIGLLGFVVVHMIGNLHAYEGPIQMAEYGEALRDLGGEIVPRTVILWIMRLGLIAMFALHIHSAYTLKEMSRVSGSKANRIDGQERYQGGQDFIAADFASRTMRWTGPIIGLFLLYHLADLTWGWFPWTDWVRGDPYHNLTQSLGNWPVALLYIAANVALAIHIFHGTWSLFQSLGINNPRYNGARRGLATGLAGLILIGNLSFPIMVQAGLLSEDGCDAPCGLHEEGEEHGG
ncbi:MAG: succinate dehydrogenase cytochrome b subunit, partial [Actinomycetota bacterium]